MKRRRPVLDEKPPAAATRLGGEGTDSETVTVTRALEDHARRIKARRILELAGSGLWEGDLAEMRGDQPA